MRDKRRVDEVAIQELGRILAIRKREARLWQWRRYEDAGRVVARAQKPLVNLAVEQAVPAPEQKQAVPELQAIIDDEPAIPDEYYEAEPVFEDEYEARRKRRARSKGKAGSTGKSSLGKVWNRLLLVVELVAVVGLVFVFVTLLQTLQAASQTTADIQAQAQATLIAQQIPATPTPVINVSEVVLPEGHTVQLNGAAVVSASFNLNEVPAQYRTQYLTFVTQPLVQPTLSPQGPVRIQIPRINVNSTIVSGDTWEALQLVVGHHIGSANPGERGNMVLSAHNDVFGETFRHLDQMQPGDTITVSTITRVYTYLVQGRRLVNPTDVWVLQSTGDSKQLTLISCYPYQVDNQRIVVFATLES